MACSLLQAQIPSSRLYASSLSKPPSSFFQSKAIASYLDIAHQGLLSTQLPECSCASISQSLSLLNSGPSRGCPCNGLPHTTSLTHFPTPAILVSLLLFKQTRHTSASRLLNLFFLPPGPCFFQTSSPLAPMPQRSPSP